MNPILKRSLISGLVSGLLFAGMMEGFYSIDKYEFDIWRPLLNFIFFGILMALLNLYTLKKQEKNLKK